LTPELAGKRALIPGFATILTFPALQSRPFVFKIAAYFNFGTTYVARVIYSLDATAPVVLYSLYLDCGSITDNERISFHGTLNGSPIMPWSTYDMYSRCPIGESETDALVLQLLLNPGDKFELIGMPTHYVDTPEIILLGLARGWFV
jgi:hypothetical protein